MPTDKHKQNGVLIDAYDFFATEDTVKINLSDRYWVRLKRSLDYGEQAELEGSIIRGLSREQMLRTMENGSDVLQLDPAKTKLLRMALYIDDWNLVDGSGSTVRLPAKLDDRIAVIRHLNVKWALKISAEIDTLVLAQAEDGDDEADDPKPSGAASADDSTS